MHLRRKRFGQPDQVRDLAKARIELVELGELAVGRAIFQPGWRWSEHVKPIAGTPSCEVHHIGYVVSGHVHIEMDDGACADLVAGDIFEIPPGHDGWVVGDEPWVSIDWAGRRLFAQPSSEVAQRVLRSIAFTDLSGSTQTVRVLGDARWRTLLADHNQATREAIERHGGREVDTAGDGFFVVFDSPAAAVRGSAAMLAAARRVGLTARAGIHTGEVELQGPAVRGIAVHLAARVLGVAGPDEILVTSTTRDLLDGSELAFTCHGEFDLRGIDGRRTLHRLVP
jgi:class 3 adenylate cyclase/quercetin dioxygenase-like cupin family protein